MILSRASEKHKTALLIEGDKDGRIYRKVIDYDHCRTFPAGNRAIAEEALGILKAVGQKGVLAIVDADTDHLANRKSHNPDVILTHTRDAEGILLQSQALRYVLTEFDIDGVFGPSPELAAIAAVAPVGYMRFIAEKNGWVVRTSKLDFAQFVDPTTLRCDTALLCKHMADLTITPGITAVHYETEMLGLAAQGHDASKVARGHDATSLLAWSMSIVKRNQKRYGIRITTQIVESYLRAAYPEEAFAKCELRRDIERWEANNLPFRVLRR